MSTAIDLQPLMCKVSKGAYQKYIRETYGVGTCDDNLTDDEIEDLLEDIELLQYVTKNKSCVCDKEKLIANLI